MWLVLLQQTPSNIIPWSGILICFLPLATIILGFIAAAVVTDRHARRPYLRFKPGNEAPPKVESAKLVLDQPLPTDTQIVNR